jgi:hypothetical protein
MSESVDSTSAVIQHSPRALKQLSDAFPIQNSLNQGDALLILLFSSTLEFFISDYQELKMKERRQPLVSANWRPTKKLV